MDIGVDIGGTFTDLVMNLNGELKLHKLLSTPENPAQAMLTGLNTMSSQTLTKLHRIAHGTTVATNAILERKGARIAFITTQGFRDILFIGRQERLDLYALVPQLPPPLVPRSLCYEVPERLDHTGAVLTPLDLVALDLILDDIGQQKVDAIAVCFLFSYLNPIHEQAVKNRIVSRGLLSEWQIALSSDVLPEFREYERASTVVLDAYVRPVINRYFTYLENHLPAGSVLRMMKSDGGLVSVERAQQRAVQIALSGPAAGVIGAFHVAQTAGFEHIITLDMGGTSTDVALCPGKLVHRPESHIGDLPIRLRLLDIETIGAGGGSIARIDEGGALRVGPQSAGADPGPIVYGRGGEQVTVSDANALLGRLDADHFLDGGLKLHINDAQQAVEFLSQEARLTPPGLALGIIEVANANIERALRRVSIARGYDPRDFTLVAFGGAGPLHACEVADRLEIPRVLIPRYPGVMCAYGLLVADVTLDYGQAVMSTLSPIVLGQLTTSLKTFLAQAQRDLRQEGIRDTAMVFQAQLDMRYVGQAYELPVPLAIDEELTASELNARFHEIHAQRYGHRLPDRPVELINLRVTAVGVSDKPEQTPETLTETDGTGALLGQKDAVFHKGKGVINLYDRALVTPGTRFHGPALVFQLDSTVYIPPAWSMRVDAFHNLIVEKMNER